MLVLLCMLNHLCMPVLSAPAHCITECSLLHAHMAGYVGVLLCACASFACSQTEHASSAERYRDGC